MINAKGAAEARLLQAQAESDALNLFATALKDNPDLLNYTFINKIGSGVSTIFLPNDVPYLLPLPTSSAPATSTYPDLFPTPYPTPLPTPTATP